MIKKLLLPLLIMAFVLAACGAPDEDAPPPPPAPVEVVVVETEIVEVVVEVEVEVEKIVEVMVTPTATETPAESGIYYLQVTSEHARLYTMTDLVNDAGLPIFVPSDPEVIYDNGEFIIAYNGKGEGDEAEFYIVDDHLAIAEASFPNAQEFVCALEGASLNVYDDPAGICSDGYERIALFPGRWEGDGGLYFYKVAGPDGAGMFVLASNIWFPSCGDLILSDPDTCNQ